MTESEGLSTKVDSAGVVMVNLNVYRSFLHIPDWIKPVGDRPFGEGFKSSPGKKILDERLIGARHLIDDIMEMDFMPLRLVVINRAQGITTRMCLVCVHLDRIQEGETRISDRDEEHLREVFRLTGFNGRVYRNPGERGGNFVIDFGNPYRLEGHSVNHELRIDVESREFKLSRFEDQMRKRGHQLLSQIKR